MMQLEIISMCASKSILQFVISRKPTGPILATSILMTSLMCWLAWKCIVGHRSNWTSSEIIKAFQPSSLMDNCSVSIVWMFNLSWLFALIAFLYYFKAVCENLFGEVRLHTCNELISPRINSTRFESNTCILVFVRREHNFTIGLVYPNYGQWIMNQKLWLF